MARLQVSVVVPVLNCKQYIGQCLQSVCRQTYGDVELIVIDGGSTDGTVEIINRYRDQISYFYTGPDSGQAAAINHGFRIASGSIFCWLNADEAWLPHTLEKVSRSLGAGADLVYGNTLMRSEKDDSLSFVKMHPRVNAAIYFMLFTGLLPSDATFWTSSLHLRLGGRLNESKYNSLSMDRDWFARMCLLSKKSVYLDTTLSQRIDRPDAATRSADPSLIKNNSYNVYVEVLKQYRNIPRPIASFLFNFVTRIMIRTSRRLRRNREGASRIYEC